MQPHVWNSFDSGMWPDGSLEAARQELILAALVSEVRTYVSARADLTPSEVCNFGNLSPWHVMPGTKPRKLLTLAQTLGPTWPPSQQTCLSFCPSFSFP